MKKFMYAVSAALLIAFSVKSDIITVTAVGNIVDNMYSAVTVGTAVEYTFQFDTEQSGSYVVGNTPYLLSDFSDHNYFYADFQGDFALPTYYASNNITKLNYGLDYPNNYASVLTGGSGSHYTQIYAYTSINAWRVGSSLYGQEVSYKDSRNYELVNSNLTITDFPSVPEPSTLILMFSGIGLLGTSLLRSSKRKKV